MLAVAVGYELVLASAGAIEGGQFPARYLSIVIPLIAIPLAVVIQEVRAALFVFVPLLAVSLVFAVAAVRDHVSLYPIGERTQIFGARTTATLFPIVQAPSISTSFVVSPGDFQPHTGKVRGKFAVARAGRDAPGYVLWGPFQPLSRGTYRASSPSLRPMPHPTSGSPHSMSSVCRPGKSWLTGM